MILVRLCLKAPGQRRLQCRPQLRIQYLLANPNAGSATVYLTFAQADGQQAPVTQPITIPAGGHWAGVLGDLYPAIQGKTGIVYLVSDVPLLGVGIQFKGEAYISVSLLTLRAN